MARHPAWTHAILSEADFDAITAAVQEAERGTSGEIRVHLEQRVHRPRGTPPDALHRARAVFGRLGMHRAAARHGVLIYLAVEDRKVAIVGDEGIHARVGDEYWARIRDLLVGHLRRGSARDAIVDAVREVGRELARHFPRERGDRDEPGDEVTVD